MELRERLTETCQALTTLLFRCRGLAEPNRKLDRLGRPDLFFWSAGLVLGGAWFLGLYLPQSGQNDLLAGRLEYLTAQSAVEAGEVARLEREVRLLEAGDKLAWERAARETLNWVGEGERVDMAAWRRESATGGARGVQSSARVNSGAPRPPAGLQRTAGPPRAAGAPPPRAVNSAPALRAQAVPAPR